MRSHVKGVFPRQGGFSGTLGAPHASELLAHSGGPTAAGRPRGVVGDPFSQSNLHKAAQMVTCGFNERYQQPAFNLREPSLVVQKMRPRGGALEVAIYVSATKLNAAGRPVLMA